MSIIAVDIDDVLSAYGDALIKFSNDRWGTNLSAEDIHEDWARMWQIDHQTMQTRAEALHNELFKSLAHNEEAKPVLKKLSKKYELVIATSRQSKLLGDTKEWIDKYYEGIFSKIHFAGIYDGEYHEHKHKMTKKGLMSEIGADYLIDDQPKHCIAAAEAGVKSLLFGDYPWNRIDKVPKGVERVKTWDEVAKYFGV